MKRIQNMDYSVLVKLGNFSIVSAWLIGIKKHELIQQICKDLCEKRKYMIVNNVRIYVCVDYCNECERECKKYGLKVRTIYTNSITKKFSFSHIYQ